MIRDRLVKILKAIVFVLLLLSCIFLIFAIKNKVYDSYGIEGGYLEKFPLQNAEYSFDGETFKDYELFQYEDKNSKRKNMIVRGIVDSDEVMNPVLYITTDSNYYEVYIDGVKILKKERIGVIQVFTAVDFAPIPKSADNKVCEIFLYTNSPEDIANEFDVYVTNKFQVVSELIYGGIGSVIFAVFAIIAGILLLMATISVRYRSYGLGVIGYTSILMGIVWIFSYSKLTILFVNNPYLVAFGSTLAIYQVPIAMLLFAQKYEQNKTLKGKYQTAISLYLIFLFGILFLETLEIVAIQEFTSYIAMAICCVYFICLIIFVNLIRGKKNNVSVSESVDIIKKAAMGFDSSYDSVNYENAVFRRYIPIIFTIFVIINIIGTLGFIFTGNQHSYIIAMGISTSILLVFCCLLFSYDLKKTNAIAITDQERRVLNKKRISILVEEQSNIFNENNIIDACGKFSENIKGILFPYGDIEQNNYKISSYEVRNQYIADYKFFKEQLSSIIYVVLPDDSGLQNNRHIICSATGEFEKYLGLDPQKVMSKEEFGELLFIMKGIKEVPKTDIAVKIGADMTPKGLLLFKNVGKMDPMLKGLLESYVRTCAILIENLNLIQEAKNTQYDTVYNLNEISELRSKETGYHIKRVSLYSALLGKKIGMSNEEIEILQLASSMHDIGKISIPDKILNKPGKLTDTEFEIMKTHAELGHDILKNTNNNVMRVGAIVAKYHHEKVNGKGYFGLKSEEIPTVAKIVAVADVFDALSVTRVYKDAWPLDKIIDLFKKERGQQFDEELVDILFENLGEFLEIRDRYKEGQI